MEEIAGYRVVRVVRDEGERRVVAAFGDVAVELHVGVGGAAASVAGEAEVLLGVAHRHLLPVLDVASVDGAVVLVRPATASTVADWLVVRAAPHAGEVVTVAAPVLAAVAALHAHGAVAGRIDLRSIVLDDDGAPALVGVDARRETDAWRATSAGVAADCAALRALVGDLVAAAGARMPDDVREALERHDVEHASHALLAAWPALPIEHVRHEPAPPRRGRERVRVDDGASIVVRVAQTLLAHAATVRRPVWVAAGAGAIALVAAIVVGGAGASSAANPPSAPSASATSPEPAASTPPAPDVAAVDAAAALLAAREGCLDADDDACLAGIVDASGGAAAATWRMPGDATLAEAAVLGDAVLLDVASDSEPASVLVVRTDAGWLLRDLWSD